jgi:long-chain fatty acid transport protein
MIIKNGMPNKEERLMIPLTRSLCGRFASALLLMALTATISFPQTNTENFAQFRFNFNNPGARATGMGGAFVSISDDATASESNPAGLTALIRPEISLEGKGIQFTNKVNNFSATGTAANYTVESHEFKQAVFSPSFVSAVYPLRRMTFSVYRYELVHFESKYFTKGAFVSPLKDGTTFFPVNSDTKLTAVNWGASMGYKFSGKFSVGISGGASVGSVTSTLTRYLIPVFNPGTVANEATIDGSDTQFFLNAGIIYHPTDELAIGAIYKHRPSFSVENVFRIASTPADSIAKKMIKISIPSSIGLGVSYRPTDVLTLAVDAVYIQYSRLTDDLVPTISEQYLSAADFKVDNGVEIHGGAEYVFLIRSVALVVRGGAYLEPDNRIRWVGKVDDTTDPNRTFSRQLSATLFQKGDSYVHGTFGLGLVLSNNFQFDVAGNVSSVTKELTGSLVVRF